MVNNAGISTESTHEKLLRVHETPEAEYDLTMAINTKGVFLGCKYATAQMLKQEMLEGQKDRGWIVNTASIQALVGYSATRKFPFRDSAVFSSMIHIDILLLRVEHIVLC